ncbi:DUF397 domain-containing protein [Micromonospora rubida]|uniref:DUF397 domain-containing protein n=1 Tax=Micromonospora rubida TaxID=2697657 RepID=A0ABW7SGG6_9ACTN
MTGAPRARAGRIGRSPTQAVAVCDSKDPAGPVLAFDPTSWAAFVVGVPNRASSPGGR